MNEFGLLDYLTITAALVFWWKMYMAAHPPPAGADKKPPEALAVGAIAGSPARFVPAAEADQPLAEMLGRICRSGGCANVGEFLDGAKLSYELICQAFARGELDEHAHLLTAEVKETFLEAIAERRARGETISLMFIGLKSADVVDAGLDSGTAWIEVDFVAELVSVTRDREGKVIAGAPERVVDIAERWTFARELRATAPVWLLAATNPDA